MFWTRLASGVVLVILSIVTLYFGGLVTLGVTAVLSLIGIFELCRVYKIEKKAPAIAAYIWTILYYLLLGFDLQKWVMPLLIVYLLVVLAIYVFAFPKFHDKETIPKKEYIMKKMEEYGKSLTQLLDFDIQMNKSKLDEEEIIY